MIPVVTPEEMRAVDAGAPEPLDILVERAGRAVALAAVRMLGGVYGRSFRPTNVRRWSGSTL